MDKIFLVIGHGISHKTHNAQTARHRRSRTLTISRKHTYFNILSAQFPDGFHGSHSQLVLDSNDGKQITLTTKIDNAVAVRFILCQHISQDIRQVGLIIFQQFMAPHPIFHTLIGHSDTFSGNAFETIQMGRNNLLFPFQSRDDSFGQRMVGSRLGSKQHILVMFFLTLCPQPANHRWVPFRESTRLVKHHNIHIAHLLQSRSIPDKDMITSSLIDTYRQSYRNSHSYGTRARHHQYG